MLGHVHNISPPEIQSTIIHHTTAADLDLRLQSWLIEALISDRLHRPAHTRRLCSWLWFVYRLHPAPRLLLHPKRVVTLMDRSRVCTIRQHRCDNVRIFRVRQFDWTSLCPPCSSIVSVPTNKIHACDFRQPC